MQPKFKFFFLSTAHRSSFLFPLFTTTPPPTKPIHPYLTQPFFFFCCCQIIVDVSDMVSKATVVKTGRQAGAHSVAEWKTGGERDEATHSGRCTTSSPALTAVTVKTFSLCLLCLGVTRGDNMEERGKGHRSHEANEWRREEEGWGVRWGEEIGGENWVPLSLISLLILLLISFVRRSLSLLICVLLFFLRCSVWFNHHAEF